MIEELQFMMQYLIGKNKFSKSWSFQSENHNAPDEELRLSDS